MQKESLSRIGYIAKSHGISGNLILQLDGPFAEDLEPGDAIFIDIDGSRVPFFILEITPAIDSANIKLEFVEAETEIKRLLKRDVFLVSEISENQSPESWKDFIIHDRVSGREGRVVNFEEDPHNPLLIADFSGREILIPLHDDFINSPELPEKRN